MIDYIIRRLLWAVVVLLGVSILTFSIIYIVPNDPGLTIAGPRASKEVRAQIEEDLGLNEPLHVQYFMYMKKILHGDLGTFLDLSPEGERRCKDSSPVYTKACICRDIF